MSGSLSPTSSPTSTPTSSPTDTLTLSPAWAGVGCPQEFDFSYNTAYDEGDRVTYDGNVYVCKSWPDSIRCTQAGYEPGYGVNWEEGWELLGSCTGSRE